MYMLLKMSSKRLYSDFVFALFLAHPPYCQAIGYPVSECGVRKKELSGGCFFVGAHCFSM